ncbi:hypothetical protein AAVH_29901, partial [Aphelenchoides avenae]
SATASGRIHRIFMHTDFQRVTPSVLEALPFLAAEIASLQLYCPTNPKSQLTPAHQSEKLLRNCIDRGVYSLKLVQEDGLGKPCIPTEESSDVSEETILEFCFAPGNARPDRPTQVELWLDWIDLSPEFLSRFIQASESCDSDHTVKLLLRGANVGKQDWSQLRHQDSHSSRWDYIGDSLWTHEGKYALRVVRSLQEGFFFAHRSTLFPADEWYFDPFTFVISELDAKKNLYLQ